MEDRQDVTVPMPEKLKRQINEQLDYGDSRAEWIREAILMRLDDEGVDIEQFDDVLDESVDIETDGGEVVAIAD